MKQRLPEFMRISAQAVSLWELPSFDTQGAHVVSRDEPEPEPPVEAPPPPPPEEVAPEAVQPLTLEELERIRQDAYNEGFQVGEQEGFHAGQLRARQEAEVLWVQQVRRLEGLMTQLMAPIQQQDQAIEEALVDLLGQLARAVIRRELSLDSSQIRQVVLGALKLLPMGAQNIRIHLHPEDFELIKVLRERHEADWRLLADESLLPGGCRVETEHSLIDASVETRLEQVLQQLAEQKRLQVTQPAAPDLHWEASGET